MLLAGISGWRQIESVDPEPETRNIVNITSNYSTGSAHKYFHESRPLVLKPETQESNQLQLNLIIICSFLLVLILHTIFRQSRKAGLSGLFALACLAMTTVLGPIIGSILLVLACYRQCILAVLKATCKQGSFAGLMKGNDAFWALEEDCSRSVINILALADFNFIVEASNNNEEPLTAVQELIEERLLSYPYSFSKLLCYRRCYMGYFYWEQQPCIDVKNHVRWLDIDEVSFCTIDNRKFIPEMVLQNLISSISNSPLPANHLSGWEIVVGRYPVLSECSTNNSEIDTVNITENGVKLDSPIKYPVLFRVHHSLGDGVALVRLLLDALADPCTRTPSRTPTPSLDFYNRSSISIDNRPTDDRTFCEHTSLNIHSSVIDNHCNNLSIASNERTTMKKSSSYNFEQWDSDLFNNEDSLDNKTFKSPICLRHCVRAACQRFIKLIEETEPLNRLHQTQSLQDIKILINDIPTLNTYNSIDRNNSITIASADTDTLPNVNSMCDNSGVFKRYNFVTREDRKRFNGLFIDEVYAGCETDNHKTDNLSSVVNFIQGKLQSAKNILYHLVILSLLPATVTNQVIARTCDTNAIHGQKLSGYKVVAWYLEETNDKDKSLMSMIERIKLFTGAHFSDVILTALSNSFEDFFKKSGEVPNTITAVIPARIGRPNREEEYNAKVSTATIKSKELDAKVTRLYLDRNARKNHSILYESSESSLDNRFSVALLTVPIASEPNEKKLFAKLKQVQSYTDVLRKSADYIVNYWILNVVATLFPIPLLRNMVKSTQSSLVVSNMPGPQTLARLAGHLLHNIVFWVPNRETTGVGITILSYSGRLQLGIIADRALIPSSQDAQRIVLGVVDAIKEMDKISLCDCQ